MARQITPFLLQTRIQVDASKAHSEFKAVEGEVKKVGEQFTKAGKQAKDAFKGAEAGSKFGKDFGASAVAAIGSSFSVSTLGSIIGTAVAPGIGTAVGSAIGSGIDSALSKVTPIVLQQIQSGIELNKLLEETAFEFKTFTGSEQEANKYLKELLDISKDVGILPQILIDASEKTYDLTGNLKLTRSILKAATDQAADFGGSVEVFEKIAETLGLIAEKGEITGTELKKLFRVGIDARKILAEATGLQEKEIESLMKAGRLRGDVAARLIAEGIERQKGGFAAARTAQTIAGRERQFGVLTQLRSMEGTQNVTRALGDFYGQADAILNSPQAKGVVEFIDRYAGVLVDFTEKSLKTGVSIGGGIAEGLLNFNPASMMSSFTKLGGFVESGLKSVFEIKSPSERSAREVGEPLGEGIGVGMARRFRSYMLGQGTADIASTLEELLKDPRIQSFLDLISRSETGKPRAQSTGRLFGPLGTTDPSKYFSATAGWAGMRTFSPSLHKMVYTSPLGGGQIVTSTAKEFSRQTGLNLRMDQRGQDMIMTWLISKTPGALEAIQRGDLAGAMKLMGGTWESFKTYNRPGTASASKLISEFGGGAGVSKANPLPVYVVSSDAITMADRQKWYEMFGTPLPGQKPVRDIIGGSSAEPASTSLQDVGEAVVNITDNTKELVSTTADYNRALGPSLRVINPVIQAQYELANAQANHANTAIGLTKDYQEAARKELIMGTAIMDKLQGVLGQAAGMIPGQQVGKKRGFWSKVLGFAAPFLSFIPGVGGILSTIVGAASGIAGGNYASAVTGIAGGFSTGGAFRSSPRVGSAGVPGTQGHEAHRALGGPVYRGRQYIVGERQPELFVPNSDGYVHPNVGGGTGRGWDALFERLAAQLERMQSMRPDDVVMMGHRGLYRAMDSNADVSNQMGRRLRLA